MHHVTMSQDGDHARGRPLARAGLLGVLAVVLAACGAGVTTTGFEPLPPTSMPLPTGAASFTAAPTLPDSETSPRHLPLGPLAAGDYVSIYMKPSVGFVIPDGFTLRDEETDLVRLTWGPDQFPPDLAIFRVANQGVVDALAGNPTLQVSHVSDVTFGLGVGRSIDVQATGADAQDISVASSADTDAAILLLVGTRGRVVEFDLDGAVLIVMFAAPANEFDRFASEADGVVTSVEIETP